MKMDSIVYRKIYAQITLLGLHRHDVAAKLGVSDGTLYNKLCGRTPFTLDEALKIKQILAIPSTIEEAFERYERSAR